MDRAPRKKARELKEACPQGSTGAKIVGHNTVRFVADDGATVGIRLHDTQILTMKGTWITLNSGGWRTMITKERMNHWMRQHHQNLAPTVQSDKGQWKVYFPWKPGTPGAAKFVDGMRVNPYTYEVLYPAGRENADRIIVERVDRYVKALKMSVERTGHLPRPSPGDCFICQTGMGGGHIREHLKEKYLMGTLIVRAMESKGYHIIQNALFFQYMFEDQREKDKPSQWTMFVKSGIKATKEYLLREARREMLGNR